MLPREARTKVKADTVREAQTKVKADASREAQTKVRADAARESRTKVRADAARQSRTKVRADAARESRTKVRADASLGQDQGRGRGCQEVQSKGKNGGRPENGDLSPSTISSSRVTSLHCR